MIDFWVANWNLSQEQAASFVGPNAVMMVDTLHTTLPLALRSNLRKFAGYTTGTADIRWTDADFESIAKRHDRAIRIDQSNGTSPFGWDVKDVESGGSTIAACVAACAERERLGFNTVCYVSAGLLPSLKLALRNRKLPIGRVVAVQYASPSSNPNTPLPGATLSLREANCDLSMTRADWFPLSPDKPFGVANGVLHFDLSTDSWKVAGAPGSIHMTPDGPSWSSAEVQFNRHTGEWRVAPLPWNAKPLGG